LKIFGRAVFEVLETSVFTGRDVPGQTGTGRPAVPLSRDKDIFLVPVSLCPGTRAGVNVPGRPGTKSLSIFAHFQKKVRLFKKKGNKVLRDVSFHFICSMIDKK
jgi:hypothetical protein